ncbi:Ribokinase-like protein [Scheffersomyces coipomensis]|uniref:Ribokinase-like protein n=1 Tax=Scheffersomyces coipomensis TaxID=1788519 RepID=UPI00315D12F4
MLRNKTQKELIQLSKQLIQPLLPNFHKGQAGRVVVIGGCEDYTGAPFFSSHSAALIGADLSHVICEKLAAPVIKSYSPDLMIHPYLFDLNNPDIQLSKEEISKISKIPIQELIESNQPKLNTIIDDKILPKVQLLLERSDIVVIGPGFGRDPLMLKSLSRIIEEIKVLNKPIVLDADALYLISVSPSLIKNYTNAYLTPNVVEFDRIAKALKIKSKIDEDNLEKLIEETIELSKKLGNVTIIRKGKQELIVHKNEYLINDMEGSSKRVGGQGDTLTGALATIINWSNNYNKKVWDFDPASKERLTNEEANLLACFTACTLVRTASKKAFKKYKRAMQTSNIHEFLGETYDEYFDSVTYTKL